MAKMFYSLDEAAAKLGVSTEEVRRKIEAGELSEFRSGDDLVVKREQVDMLAGDTGDGLGLDMDDLSSDEIGLSDSVLEDDSPIIDTGHDSLIIGLDDSAGDNIGISDDAAAGSFGLGDSADDALLGDSGGGSLGLDDDLTMPSKMGSTSGRTPADSGIGLGGSGIGLGGSGVISLASEASGSGMEVESPKDQTGISIFDDGMDGIDSSEATLVTDSPMFETDASASGSGLLDLTREGDDTSLGVDLLDDGYGAPSEEDAAPAEAGALFETTAGGEADITQAAPMMVFQEAYDGAGSGLVGGLALGVVCAMLFLGAIVFMALVNQPGTRIIDQLGGTMNVGVGEVPVAVLAVAGVTVIGAVIGLVLGKRS